MINKSCPSTILVNMIYKWTMAYEKKQHVLKIPGMNKSSKHANMYIISGDQPLVDCLWDKSMHKTSKMTK